MEQKKIIRKKEFKGERTTQGIIKLFKIYFRNSRDILDIGAGSGFLDTKIRKKFKKRVIGADLDPENEKIIKADIAKLPFKSGSFDLVLIFDVVEHLSTSILNKGLKEVRRVLRDRGIAIVSTILNEDLNKLACFCPKCGYTFHRIGHIQSFSEKELDKLFSKHNFKVAKRIKTNLYLYSKSMIYYNLLLLINKLLPLPKEISIKVKKDIVYVIKK